MKIKVRENMLDFQINELVLMQVSNLSVLILSNAFNIIYRFYIMSGIK